MKSLLGNFGFWGLLAANVAGCGGLSASEGDRKGDGTDSNTHWMSQCREDAECDDELSCVCGVCSSSCAGETSCRDFGAAGMCLAAQCKANSDTPTLLCSSACDGDADCAGNTRCEGGLCLPERATSGEAVGSLPVEPDVASGPEPEPDTAPEPNAASPEPAPEPDATSPEPPEPEPDSEPVPVQGCGAEGSSVGSKLERRENLCDAAIAMQGEVLCVNLAGLVERESASTAIGCEPDTACCNWTWSAYVVKCSEGNLVLTAEGAPFGTQIAPSDGFDDSFGNVEVTMGCQGMDCNPTCVPEGESAFGWVRLRVEPAEEGFVTPGEQFEPFSALAELVIEEAAEPETAVEVTPIVGCEGVDARGDNSCDIAPKWAWSGFACEPVSCNCEGSDCDRLQETREGCETVWAGCTESVPQCPMELPSTPPATLDHTLDPDDDGANEPDFSDWTASTWPTPLPLPNITTCDAEGDLARLCPESRLLELTSLENDPLQLTVGLAADLWAQLDLVEGREIEFMLDQAQFAVRDTDSDEVFLLIGTGPWRADPEPVWAGPGFTIRAGGPFCTLRNEEEDCNWLDVVQYLRVETSGASGQETVTLEPYSDTAFTILVGSGDAPYRLVQGRSIHAGLRRPMLEACAAFRTRGDSFALVRVAE
jgi:hypothetical protein